MDCYVKNDGVVIAEWLASAPIVREQDLTKCVTLDGLYTRYAAWCAQQQRKPCGLPRFFQEIGEHMVTTWRVRQADAAGRSRPVLVCDCV